MALFLDMRWRTEDGSRFSTRIACVEGTFTLPEHLEEDVISVEEAQRRARPDVFKPEEHREWSLRIVGNR